MVIRDQIIQEARSWIGTRWQHQGRVKKNSQFQGGVDCLGLILEVGNALQLFSQPLIYHRYHRLPHDNLLLTACDRYACKKSIMRALPGDILVFRMHTEPQHLALLTSQNTMVHAYAQARAVVEHSLDDAWQRQLVAVYAYPEITDDD